MTLHTIPIIRNLHNLQDQIAATPGYANALRAALDLPREHLTAIGESLEADRHMRALALTAARITSQIQGADHLDGAPASLSELVLRATRLVLIVELAALDEVVRGADPPPPLPFPAPPWTIDDLIGALRADLDDVTQGWRAERADRARYRHALRVAHAAMRRMDVESQAVRQLREGASRLDWPELQDVCVRMLAVLRVRIDVDPDAPILVRTGADRSEEDRS
jgi:hypothetical protein